MNRAGGIVAIIGGIFGIFAAGATLLVGGIGGAVHAEGASRVVGFGWGGVAFSFLVIVIGAIGIGATTKKPGVLLIVSSIGGIVLGGTFVAVFMILSLVGGILVTVGVKAPASPPSTDEASTILARPSGAKMRAVTKGALWAAGLLVGLVLLAAVLGPDKGTDSLSPSVSVRSPETPPRPPTLNVGDTFTTPAFAIHIRSAEMRSSVGGQLFTSRASHGGVYVAIQWSYRNMTAKPISAFRTPRVRLKTPEGAIYNPDLRASAAYASEVEVDRKIVSDLNPGIWVVDAAVFEVSRTLFDITNWRIVVDADEDAEVQFVKRSEGRSD